MTKPSSYPLFATILAAALLGAPLPSLADDAARDWFTEQGYVPPRDGRIVACHGYGCSRRLQVMVDGILARAAATLNRRGATAESERRALEEIVQAYTAQLAKELGTPDTPGSPRIVCSSRPTHRFWLRFRIGASETSRRGSWRRCVRLRPREASTRTPALSKLSSTSERCSAKQRRKHGDGALTPLQVLWSDSRRFFHR